MNDVAERRWLRRHAVLAPFGIFAATILLAIQSGQWEGWGNLGTAANLVDMGAVLYGMAAVLAERGVRMIFWALEERRKMIENRKMLGKAELVAEFLAEGIPQTNEQLERWARDKGIPLDKLSSRRNRGKRL